MELVTLMVGPLEVNCYIVGCDEHKKCFVIDAGDSSKRILAAVQEKGWELKGIICTHAHVDHTGANEKIMSATGAKLYLHEDDLPVLRSERSVEMANYIGVKVSPEPDETLRDGDKVALCDCVCLEVIHTPGHSPGGVCLKHDGILFSGDTLFRMSIGRADLEGGNMQTLLSSIKTKLYNLPDDIVIYPGHGEPTNLEFEKRHNPFLAGAYT